MTEVQFLRQKYRWSVMVIMLRRAGYSHQEIADALNVKKTAVSNWAMPDAGRRPKNPRKVLDFARPIIGDHMIRVCAKPEFESEAA